MADKFLSSVSGSDLSYGVIEQVSGAINAGQSGELLSVEINQSNPKDIIVLYLVCANGGNESGITFSANGFNIFENKQLSGSSVTSSGTSFLVCRNISGVTENRESINILDEVSCKTFSISKVGAVQTAIYYAYEIRRPLI